MTQTIAVAITIVYTTVASYIILKIVDLIVGLRVAEEVEREGLDINEHGEKAYHM
jgi:Amt family ammonium transporter